MMRPVIPGNRLAAQGLIPGLRNDPAQKRTASAVLAEAVRAGGLGRPADDPAKGLIHEATSRGTFLGVHSPSQQTRAASSSLGVSPPLGPCTVPCAYAWDVLVPGQRSSHLWIIFTPNTKAHSLRGLAILAGRPW